jgi:hypothetical protein
VLLKDWIERRLRDDLRSAGVLGWAWATVDLERALGDTGSYGERRWTTIDDELLGARGLRLSDTEPAIILLEPSTEGRLAGWLARHGEGEAAVYAVAPTDPRAIHPRRTALGRSGWIGEAEREPRSETSRLTVLVEPASSGSP